MGRFRRCGNLRVPGVQVAGDEITEEIILGRNILNKLPLFLDGPKQVAELLSDPATQRLRTAREAG